MLFVFLDSCAEKKSIELNKIDGMLITYVVFGIYAILTGVFVAIDVKELLSSAFTYISFTVVVACAWYVSYRTRDMKWLVRAMYCIAVLCAFTTIFFGKPYNNGVIVTTMSPTNNPNALGIVMVAGIFAAVINKDDFDKHFFLNLVSVLAFLYVIAVCGSRKCLLAGVLLFGCWLVEYFIENRKSGLTFKKLLISLTLLAGIAGGLYYVITAYVGSNGYIRLLKLFTEGTSNTRFKLYKLAFEYWKEHPIFGIGLDQYRLLCPYGYYSHSTYAEILSCTGIIGCLVFFIPIIKMTVRLIKKAIKKSENSYFLRVCLIMLFTELFLGIGQIFIYDILHMLLLMFLSWSIDAERPSRSAEISACA